MKAPDRLPDEVTLSGPMPTDKTIKYPAKLIASQETLFKVVEYTEIPAIEVETYDKKIIEIWYEPEGTVARARWLAELTETEKDRLAALVKYGQ